jgi:hypothetical protein
VNDVVTLRGEDRLGAFEGDGLDLNVPIAPVVVVMTDGEEEAVIQTLRRREAAYRLDISINGNVVGHAVFTLQQQD